MQPRISVVIPVRNREKFISRSLQSVLDQTYSSLEVVIVDDFSNNNTIATINKFADHRIRLISLPSQSGAQKARNIGIKQASSEWIAFHDSDDVWSSDKLEKQVNILEQNNFAENIVVHGNGLLCNCRTGDRKKITVPKTEGLKSYNLLLSRPSPFFPCILTSKTALLEIGLLDEDVPSYQEWDTAIALSKKCRFFHLDDVLFTYVMHDGPAISQSMFKDFLGYQYVIKKYQSEIIDICGVTTFEKHLIHQLKKFFLYKIYNCEWNHFAHTASFFDDISEFCSDALVSVEDAPAIDLFKSLLKKTSNRLEKYI